MIPDSHPSHPAVRWNKVAVVGVGLLGGSLGLAIRNRGLARQVAGLVRSASRARQCRRVGVADLVTTRLAEAVSAADLVVLCTPVSQMLPLARRLLPYVSAGALVTDVGSVKGRLVFDLENVFAGSQAAYIGSHPMAGLERSGVKAARADLFDGASCVITPTRRSPKSKVGEIKAFWRLLGCRVMALSPEMHDQLVSYSSHLPQVLASVLTHVVLWRGPATRKRLCAGGFRDTTRIASGSPEMWRDIVMANQSNLLAALDQFEARLAGVRRSLQRNSGNEILRFFDRSKRLRDGWLRRQAPS